MPLPKRFSDRVLVADVRAETMKLQPGEEAAETRRIAGRVMAQRDHGRLVFLDLVDRSGRIQLLCDTSQTGEIDLDLGDVVGAEGKPAQSRRGEPSLAVDRLELLAKIRTPLPDTFHGLTDVEQRYRRRYLDLLVNQETRADFALRSRIVTAIREYLDNEDFLEVETPILQPRYGGAFAEPFVTYYNAVDTEYYLRIATELYLKRLIVGGLEKVYELGKDFRNEGLSYKHQPEFTMVEWYEAYADYRDTMVRIQELVAHVARNALGRTEVEYRGHRVDLGKRWQRIKLVDALAAHNLWTRDANELRRRLEERRVDTRQDHSWAQLVDHALTTFIEPSLVEPTILHDYPVELSPFAQATDYDDTLVERFEFFVGGTELGNAFSEINDPMEQAKRFGQQMGEQGGEPFDPDYVEALSYGMPPTGGLGLGIDRLVMVLANKDTIRDVILFPALAEPRTLVDLSVPDRWWFPPLASLLPPAWWESAVIPHAAELLRVWSRRVDRYEIVLREIDEFRMPQLAPAPHHIKWTDHKVDVARSAAEVLDSTLGQIQDPFNQLASVRPEVTVYPSHAGMSYLLRGTFNGLALLATVRHDDGPIALSAQRAFLQRSAVPEHEEQGTLLPPDEHDDNSAEGASLG